MGCQPTEMLKNDMLECVNSLHIAIDNAGGRLLSTEEMKRMSLYEFLLLISPNGIRFVYEKEKYTNEDD